MTELDIHEQILRAADRVLTIRGERDEVDIRLAAATRTYHELIDSLRTAPPAHANGTAENGAPLSPVRLTEEEAADRRTSAPAEASSPTTSPSSSASDTPPSASSTTAPVAQPSGPRFQVSVSPTTASPSRVIVTATIPEPRNSTGVRAALLRFFGGQRNYLTQEEAEGAMEKAGYDRTSVRQAIYDMTSTKVGTIDRDGQRLTINMKGRTVLAQ
jgi:hypothetical protein